MVGGCDHGCWLGTYEYAKQALFVRHVRLGMTVYDVGVHVGFYTLLASELVGEQGSRLRAATRKGIFLKQL